MLSVSTFELPIKVCSVFFKGVRPFRATDLFSSSLDIGDVKLPGAERRSNYYRRYGNPNYGGAVGLLSRSYRRRVKAAAPTTDTRCVNLANSRELVSYDEIDVDVHGLAMHLQRGSSIVDSDEDVCPPRQNFISGQRREAAGNSKWLQFFSINALDFHDFIGYKAS